MIDREFDARAYDQGFRDGRAEAATEIERLRAEVQVWINHTKTAVWSDSEECKLLTEENAKLRAALQAVMNDLEIIVECGGLDDGFLSDIVYTNARAALGGEP